jgi:hypothetical protein
VLGPRKPKRFNRGDHPVIIRAFTRFASVCLGTGLFVGGLGLSITGVGAIVGLPMMAIGMSLAVNNA